MAINRVIRNILSGFGLPRITSAVLLIYGTLFVEYRNESTQSQALISRALKNHETGRSSDSSGSSTSFPHLWCSGNVDCGGLVFLDTQQRILSGSLTRFPFHRRWPNATFRHQFRLKDTALFSHYAFSTIIFLNRVEKRRMPLPAPAFTVS